MERDLKNINREIEIQSSGWGRLSKSLDMYMPRKNFTFDTEEQQYVPMQTRVTKLKNDPKSYAPTKVASIITA